MAKCDCINFIRRLDPSMGSGRFFQNMPEEMRKESSLFGVELDPLTGRMARLAYPEAEVSVSGFEETTYPNNSFDLAISNVPFGNYRVADSSEKGTFAIHDYFIAKMIEQVRPGGLVAVVTAPGTMSKTDMSARLNFACKAQLLGAVKLPEGTFRSSGTQTGTDILIFRKRQREISMDEAMDESWVKTESLNYADDEDGMHINSYFRRFNKYILGQMKPVSTQFGYSLSCVPDDNPAPLGERITEALGHLGITYEPSAEEMPRPVQQVVNESASYSFFIDSESNRLMFSAPEGDCEPNLPKAQEQKIRSLLPLRDRVRALIELEKDSSSSDTLIQEKIGEINQLYDSYYAEVGSITLDKNLKKAFHDDVSYPLMCSLERTHFDADLGSVYDGKGDIFTERIIVPHREPDHADTARDALSISMLEHGKVDLAYMSLLTGQSEKHLLRQLENIDIFYDDEKEEYVHADEYLSGDIRGKIEHIDHAMDSIWQEIEQYASEKILPFETVRFAPRNEQEEQIVYDPYKYAYRNSNLLNVASSRQEAFGYIESHLDDKAFAAAALAYTKRNGDNLSDGSLFWKILDRYGEDARFIATAKFLEGYRPSFSSKNPEAVKQFRALLHSIDGCNDGNYSRYAYHFILEKLDEYKGREEDLLHLERGSLLKDFKAWMNAKEKEIEAYTKNLSDIRIKELVEKLGNLEQKRSSLDEVKPMDVLADEIDVKLGTTWISPKYIEDFLAETFDLKWEAGDTVNVFYSPHANTWQITNKSDYNASVTTTYGLKDKVNALTLTEQALNFKTPTIYDTVMVDGEEKRVVNEKYTQLAQQKQDLIRDAFRKWLFKDKERSDAIVSYYNRHFNSIVPRKFNGEKLSFPGMNPTIQLRDHQKNAIAQTLYGGNSLFAHAVGAGKTFEIVASAMESKRLGLARKSMIVVPNHLTEQMGAEFKQLYPDANVLVATADDFKKDKRKAFCAKIATYNWDAVVIGYSQFERIPMSQGYIEDSIRRQISELV